MSRPEAIPTREAVCAVLATGGGYEEVAHRLSISSGLAYLIATGIPVDSTDGLSPEDLARPWLLRAPQSLASPPVHAPDRGLHVRAFIRRRLATGEVQRP